jgi:hypothetical protein
LRDYIFGLFRLKAIRFERTFILLCVLFFLCLALIVLGLLGKVGLSAVHFILALVLIPLILFFYTRFGVF